MPGQFTFANGGQKVGLIPTRYPGSEAHADPAIRMARLTSWEDIGADTFFGCGQRLLATDSGEYPLMDIRSIELNSPEPEEDVPAAGDNPDG